MDSRQSLVVGEEISSALSQRLREEVARNPSAVINLRAIASRAMEHGRIPDAFLAGMMARKAEEMKKNKRHF